MKFKTLKDKFLESETQNDTLKEKCKVQESEINNLQELCSELNAVLGEFRNKNDSISEVDSSFIDTRRKKFEINQSCEHLGSTVIDLQLQDANKENTELKSSLEKLQEAEIKLNDEVNNLKQKLTVMDQQYKSSQNQVLQLRKNIDLLEESQKNLQGTLKVSSASLEEHKKQNVEFEQQISLLNTKLQMTQNENVELKKFADELEILRVDFATTVEKYNKTNFELAAFKDKYTAFDKEIAKSLYKLEKYIGCKDVVNIDKKSDSFTALLNKLNEKLVFDVNNKKTLTDQVEMLTQINKKADEQIMELRNNETILYKEKEALQISLSNAENSLGVLELEIKALDHKLHELNCDNDESQLLIDELERTLKYNLQKGDEVLKVRLQSAVKTIIADHIKKNEIIENCNSEINHLECVKNELNVTMSELNHNKTQLENELKSTTDKLAVTVNELDNANEKIVFTNEQLNEKSVEFEQEKITQQLEKENLQENLLKTTEQLRTFTEKSQELETALAAMEAEKVKKVNELIEELSNNKCQIDQLDSELRLTKTDSENKLQEFNELVKIKDAEMVAKQGEIEVLSKKMELIKETVAKLELDRKKISEDKESLSASLEQEKLHATELKQALESGNQEIGILNDEITNLKYQIEFKEAKITSFNSEKEALCNEISALKQYVNDHENSLSEQRDNIIAMQQLFEVTKQGMIADAERIAIYEVKMDEMSNEIVLLGGLKHQLEVKCKEYQAIMEKIIIDLSGKNQDYEKFIEEMQSVKTERENKIHELEKAIEAAQNQIEELNQNNNSLIGSHNVEISRLEAEKHDLLQNIDKRRQKEVEYLQEIRTIKDELNGTISKYTESLETYQESKCEYETQNKTLTENLHEFVEKFNELDKEHQEKLHLLESNQKLIEKLKTEKADVEKSLQGDKEQIYEEYLKTKDILCEEINELTGQQEKYMTEISELSNKLAAANSKINTLEASLVEATELQKKLETENTVQLEKMYEYKSQVEELKGTNNTLTKDFDILKVEISNKIVALQAESEKCQELSAKQNQFVLEIEQVKMLLSEEQSNAIVLKNALDETTNKVTDFETKKVELLQHVSELEAEIKLLKDDNIKITQEHEAFKEEIDRSNVIIKAEFDEEIVKLTKEKQVLQQKCEEIKEELSKMESETCKQIEEQDATIQENDKIIKTLQDKITDYEINVEKLIEQQNILNEQLTQEKAKQQEIVAEYGSKNIEANIKITDLDNTITKLKCAIAILETGKEKLQIDHDKLLITINKLEELIESKETSFNEQLKLKEFEMSHMKSIVSTFESEARDKQMLIEELKSDLELINSNFEQVKQDKFTVQDSLVDLENTYKDTLEKTRTSYKGKIQELSNSYEELKMKHDHVLKELSNATAQNKSLENSIKTLIEEKNELEMTIKRKECDFNSLNNESTMHITQINELENKLVENLRDITEKAETIKILESEKVKLEAQLSDLLTELELLKKSKDVILESQTKVQEETEKSIQKIHENAVETKNSLLKRIEIIESERSQEDEVRENLEKLLEEEKHVKDILNLRIVELESEKCAIEQQYVNLKHSIVKINGMLLEKPVAETIVNCTGVEVYNVLPSIESRILEVMQKSRDLSTEVSQLESEKNSVISKLNDANNEKDAILTEKAELFEKYNVICKEIELQASGNSTKELETQLNELTELNIKKYNDYQQLISVSGKQREVLEKLSKDKCALDSLITSLKENIVVYQTKTEHINENSPQKQLFEKRQNLEIIIDDLNKQFIRLSKQISNAHSNLLKTIEKSMQCILTGKVLNFDTIFENLSTEEFADKLQILKEQMEDADEQLKSFDLCLSKANIKYEKFQTKQKENVAMNGKDDDWKKKHFALKQRLTLAENAKNTFEKKLKQLREENKKLNERVSHPDDDQHYKTLLQQHLQTKEQYEKAKLDFNNDYKKLQMEFEAYKANTNKSNVKIEVVEDVERLKSDLLDIRQAYGNVLSEKSKLDLENSSLRKILDDRNLQLSDGAMIKEAYEKLLEDNNHLQTEIDTLKYKRSRDRDEYVRLIKKERDDFDSKESKKVHDVRMEYEGKLEKMKEKMIKLYKEEVNKEMKKVCVEKDENIFLLQTISELKEDLKDARSKIQKLEKERNGAIESMKQYGKDLGKRRDNPVYSSRESLVSISSRDLPQRSDRNLPKCPSYSSFEVPIGRNNRMSTSSLGRESIARRNAGDERKISTLPRSVMEESSILGRAPSLKSVSSDIGKDYGRYFNKVMYIKVYYNFVR